MIMDRLTMRELMYKAVSCVQKKNACVSGGSLVTPLDCSRESVWGIKRYRPEEMSL